MRISSGGSLENGASGWPRIAVRIGRVLGLCAFVILLIGLQTLQTLQSRQTRQTRQTPQTQVGSYSTGYVTEAQTRAPAASTSAASSAAASSGNVQTGRQLFTSEGCDKCHGSEAQGLSRSVRNDAGPRIGPTRFALPVFVRFVRNPPGLMPPYAAQAVSDAQLADVHAFLQSLAPTPQAGSAASGDAQKGQHLFTSDGCFQCHGGEGQGSTQTGGSRIGPPQIPFPVFASYVRSPVENMPPYSIQALPDPDLADIYAFLHSRPEPAPASSIPLLNQ